MRRDWKPDVIGKEKGASRPVPQPARIVETGRGREVHSPKRGRLLGIFNHLNQLEIKRGDEVVIVEVPPTK